jgi:hypothetical protein
MLRYPKDHKYNALEGWGLRKDGTGENLDKAHPSLPAFYFRIQCHPPKNIILYQMGKTSARLTSTMKSQSRRTIIRSLMGLCDKEDLHSFYDIKVNSLKACTDI